MKYLLFCSILLAVLACGEPPFTQGKAIYTHSCANCHIEDGTGLRGVVPPLVGSDALKKGGLAALPCLIIHGLTAGTPIKGRTYELDMPPNPDLTDVEIANLINYLSNEWGDKNTFVKTEDVAKARSNCP